jgi:DNA-binding CsgD family transcriptional regulator
MPSSLLEPQLAIDALEAAAQEAETLPQWIDALTFALGRLMPSPLGGAAALVERGREGARVLHATVGMGVSHEIAARVTTPPLMRGGSVDRFYFGSRHVDSMQRILPQVPSEVRKLADTFLAALCAEDVIGLSARSDANHALVVASLRPRGTPIQARDRLLLGRVALHIEAGFRMRLGADPIVAVLRPDGSLTWADLVARDVDVRARLAEHVVCIERQRLRKHRRSTDAVDAWSALVAGRYGFMERPSAQREYLVLDHGPAESGARALTRSEARAVELSALGVSGKLVAYALGITEADVSRLLGRAALKAGFATRTELVRVAALLRSSVATPESALHRAPLTPSERLVLEEIRRGQSNQEIATRRGVSVRTVANQVASILRKTRLPSRRALATLIV